MCFLQYLAVVYQYYSRADMILASYYTTQVPYYYDIYCVKCTLIWNINPITLVPRSSGAHSGYFCQDFSLDITDYFDIFTCHFCMYCILVV